MTKRCPVLSTNWSMWSGHSSCPQDLRNHEPTDQLFSRKYIKAYNGVLKHTWLELYFGNSIYFKERLVLHTRIEELRSKVAKVGLYRQWDAGPDSSSPMSVLSGPKGTIYKAYSSCKLDCFLINSLSIGRSVAVFAIIACISFWSRGDIL